MNSNDMIIKIVAISVTLLVVSMILIPIVNAATEGEITVTETGTNQADTTLGFDPANITLAYDTDAWAFDSAHAEVTTIVTSSAVIVLSGNTVTINGDAVDPTAIDSIVITGSQINAYLSGNGTPVETYNLVNIGGGYVLTDAATDKTYGMWDTVSSVLINKNVNVIVIDNDAPVLEQYNGTEATGSATITASESETYPAAYEVSAVGSSGVLVAQLTYYYNGTVDMDDNLKTIISVIPYLVIIGILMAATYLFVRGRY